MNRFIKIGKAAEILGVSVQTLRRWEKAGILQSDKKTVGQTRYYDLDKLTGLKNQETDLTIAYARVSSHDQKEDLKRQAELSQKRLKRAHRPHIRAKNKTTCAYTQRSAPSIWSRAHFYSLRSKTR